MKVKIGNKIYDSTVQPIMLILEDYEKEHIKNMIPESKKYCSFPEFVSKEEIEKFMEGEK